MGSACSHVGALLFKLRACTELDLNKIACTSTLCAWKRARKRAHPAPLKKISFKRPKKDDTLPNVDEPFTGTLTGYTSADPVKFCGQKRRRILESLREASPESVVFTSISLWEADDHTEDYADDSNGSDTDTADESESLPELLTSFYDPTAINIEDEEQLQSRAESIYNNYLKSSTQNQYDNLTNITSNQSTSNKWMLYRCGRITASNSSKAFSMDLEKPAPSTIKTIMQYYDNPKSDALTHGKKSEKLALKSYFEEEKVKHKNLKVETTGLHINANFPYLGASPDAIITCECHEDRLLEIKCPFKFKESGILKWKEDKNCPII